MAAPIPNKVVIDQGRDFQFTIYYRDPDTSAPINLTGYTATFNLATDYDTAPIWSLTVGNGITITPLLGQIDVHATQTQTSIDSGNWVAELFIASNGVETSLLKGNIVVKAKVE